jgi:hypothetical protein
MTLVLCHKGPVSNLHAPGLTVSTHSVSDMRAKSLSNKKGLEKVPVEVGTVGNKEVLPGIPNVADWFTCIERPCWKVWSEISDGFLSIFYYRWPETEINAIALSIFLSLSQHELSETKETFPQHK